MANLRLAFFAATCALLLAASASPPLPPPPAVQRDVGDEMGWAMSTMVPSVGNGTEETLTQWAERQRFHVGDVLDFKSWNGTVFLLASRGDYERCSVPASPAARQFVGVGGGGVDNVRFELYHRQGTFYFVSGAPERCEAGQRMAVRVVDAQAPPFFFAPTSGVARPPDDEPAVPAPGTTAPPATVVLKLTPSAWLWVATVGIFLLLLVGIIACCVDEQTKITTVFLEALAANRQKALATELGRV